MLPLLILAAGCSSTTDGGDDPGPDSVLLETENAVSVSAPSLAMNDDGVALVVWAQSDGTHDHVWSNHYSHGTGWGTAQTIEGYESTYVGGPPQVTIDATGNGLAIWALDDGYLWASRYTHGTGWSTAERIEGDRAGALREPRLAMDASGQALATWWVSGEATGVWANRFDPATGWQTAERLEAEGHSVQPAVNSRGDAMLVYIIDMEAPLKAGSTLFGKRYVAGAGWAEADVIETRVVEGEEPETFARITPPEFSSPQVTLAADGTALAAWTYFEHPLVGVGWARAPAEGGWELLRAPSDPTAPQEDGAGAQLFGNPTGDALAAWTPQPHINRLGGMLSRRYHPSTGWGEVEYLQGNGTDSPGTPHLAGSTSGNFIAVWTRADETRSELWFNRYQPSTGWEAAVSIASGSLSDPQAAIDGAGNALVAWPQKDGDRWDLVAQVFLAE